ncbi:hypothetical protein K492DRAFT_197739 [Lichtheimia hyalospora FSU 10163]|nr:hypothetical protein K492DRAFT_197739 [Lichtheimia hyalospora FSU 10163]
MTFNNLSLRDLSFKITQLLKESKQNYFIAEELFHQLMDDLGLRDNMGKRPCLIKQTSLDTSIPTTAEETTPPPSPSRDSHNTLPRYLCMSSNDYEIHTFQSAIYSLVRYAPNHHLALKYLCFFLEQIDPPFRNERSETTVLINIIHVFAQERHSIDIATRALDYIKIGLERDILHFPGYQSHRSQFQDPAAVFYSVSRPILARLKLEFSSDYRSIQQNTTGHVLRYNLRDADC